MTTIVHGTIANYKFKKRFLEKSELILTDMVLTRSIFHAPGGT